MHMVTLGLVAAGVAVCDSEILCRFPENEVMGASNPLPLGWGRIAPTKSYERKP